MLLDFLLAFALRLREVEYFVELSLMNILFTVSMISSDLIDNFLEIIDLDTGYIVKLPSVGGSFIPTEG